jgi:hypothetical protein
MSEKQVTKVFNLDFRYEQFLRKGELIGGILRSPDLGGAASAAIFRGNEILRAVIFLEDVNMPYFEVEARALLEDLGWTIQKLTDSNRWAIWIDAGVDSNYFAIAQLLDESLPVLHVRGLIMGDVGVDVKNRDIPDWYNPMQEFA